MEKRLTFSSEVRELVTNISRHATSHYEVLPQECTDDVVLVVANHAQLLDMEEIALALSSADHIVRYMRGNNFLYVEKNPYHTPEVIHDKIVCIPISFVEAMEKLKDYEDKVEVLPDGAGANHATVVAKQRHMRSVLSDIAMMLSSGGLFVSYRDGCNFIEFKENNEHEEQHIIKIQKSIHPNEAAVLSSDKVAATG